MNRVLLFGGVGLTGLWGTAHLFATKGAVAGFLVRFFPYRLCPFIFALSAVLIALGAWRG